MTEITVVDAAPDARPEEEIQKLASEIGSQAVTDQANERLQQALADPAPEALGRALDELKSPDGSYPTGVAEAYIHTAKEVYTAGGDTIFRLGQTLGDHPDLARKMVDTAKQDTSNSWDRLAAGLIIDEAARTKYFTPPKEDPFGLKDQKISAAEELALEQNKQVARDMQGYAADLIPKNHYHDETLMKGFGRFEGDGVTVEQAQTYVALSGSDSPRGEAITADGIRKTLTTYDEAPPAVRELAMSKGNLIDNGRVLELVPYAKDLDAEQVIKLAMVMGCGPERERVDVDNSHEVVRDLLTRGASISGLIELLKDPGSMVTITNARENTDAGLDAEGLYQKSLDQLSVLSNIPDLFDKLDSRADRKTYTDNYSVVTNVMHNSDKYEPVVAAIEANYQEVLHSGYPARHAAGNTLRVFSRFAGNLESSYAEVSTPDKPPLVTFLESEFEAMRLLGDAPAELAAHAGSEFCASVLANDIAHGVEFNLDDIKSDLSRLTTAFEDISVFLPDFKDEASRAMRRCNSTVDLVNTTQCIENTGSAEARLLLTELGEATQWQMVGALLSDPATLQKVQAAFASPVYQRLFGRLEGEAAGEMKESAILHPDAWRRADLPADMNRGMVISTLAKRLTLRIEDDEEQPMSFESPDQALSLLRAFAEYRPDSLYGAEIGKKILGAEYRLLDTAVAGDTHKLPTNPNRLLDLFPDDDMRLAYTAALAIRVQNPDLSREEVMRHVTGALGTADSKHVLDFYDLPAMDTKQALILLKEQSDARKQWLRDRDSWFKEFAGQTISSQDLTRAWTAREAALADGAVDNPGGINRWAVANELRNLAKSGDSDITEEFLDAHKDLEYEVSRTYTIEQAVDAIDFYRGLDVERARQDAWIRPGKVTVTRQVPRDAKHPDDLLAREFTVEVLDKGDPRGLSIGVDTGCCQRMGGEGENCLKAGYEDPRYAFLVVSAGGRVRAQSLIYSEHDPMAGDDDPSVVMVADNIEANAGTHRRVMIDVYQEALNQLIKEQEISKFPVIRVHLGTGHSDVGHEHLPVVDSVLPPAPDVYTDAYSQRLLLEVGQTAPAVEKHL